jgi:hypothetical protein
MKSEQIKEITEKATEQLVAALKSGHSEVLAGYLKAIGASIVIAFTMFCSSLRRNRMPATSRDFALGTNWAAS